MWERFALTVSPPFIALRLWDLEAGREEPLTLSGQSGGVRACAVSADGKRAVSRSMDATLNVWDLDAGCRQITLSGQSGSVNACVVSADGKRAASVSLDKTLKVWDLDCQTCLGTVCGPSPFYAVALAGRIIVAGDEAGNVWMSEMEWPVPQSPCAGT